MYLDRDGIGKLPECEYVYVLQDMNVTGRCKIGRTNNPARRLYEFGVKLPFETGVIRLMPTYDSVSLEKHLHNKFSKKRVSGEWFELDEDDLLELLSMESDIVLSKRHEPKPFFVSLKKPSLGYPRLIYQIRSKTSMHGISVMIYKDSEPQVWWTKGVLQEEEWFYGEQISEDLPSSVDATIVMYQMLGYAVNLAMQFEKDVS